MSTGFGVTLVAGGDLYSIDYTTGAWALSQVLSIGSSACIVYDCDASQMFIATVEVVGNNLYTVNTSTGATALVGSSPIGTPLGMAYDSAGMQMYGCNRDTTYLVDTSTNTWTVLGTSGLPSGINELSLAYDCENDRLFGLGRPPSGIANLYSVNRITGAWVLIGASGLAGANERGLTWDQTTGTIYGLGANNNQMYQVNPATGAWTIPGGFGGTGIPAPLAQAFERPCCCIHEDTQLRLVNGKVITISELKAGQQLFDYQGRPIEILHNVCTGRRSRFVRLPSDSPSGELLIQSGHPVLSRGREVECQLLGDAVVVDLEQKKRVFTVITEERTFVNILGVMVATWSKEGFENFVGNDITGRNLFARFQ